MGASGFETGQLLLTKREREVMQLTLEGLDNHGIARQLGISHRTVETHKARVLQKIGASSVVELIRMSDARIKADAQLLSDLYENAPCGYHSLGIDGTILKMNATELRWLGYRKEELEGVRKITDLLTPEGKQIFARNYPRLIEHGRLDEIRFNLVCRDGSLLPVMLSATAVYDENGQYSMSRSVLLNLGKQKQVEVLLEEAEERYRTIVEDQTEIIARIRADGSFIFVNEGYARFFGKRKEELIGKTWHPVVHPDDLARIEAGLRTLRPDHPVVVIENRVFSGEGQIHWFQFVNRAFFDDEGQIREIQSAGRDITERKQVEDALDRAYHRFSFLAGANLFGVVIGNAQGAILEANDYYLEILGRTRADLAAGRVSWKEMTPPEWLAVDYQNLANLMAHGVSPPYEKEYVRDDGSRRAVYLANIMLPDDDGRILAVVMDITDRKREAHQLLMAKQAEQEANEAKSRFLAGVSHDLKQPLTALELYAQMLPGLVAPDDSALVANIRNCVASMDDYLNELLELSKLQMVGKPLALRDFDVVEFLDQLVSSYMPEARLKNLSLRCHRLPLIARTDPVLFGRLLGNLISNAIRYTDAGGVLIGGRRCQGKYWIEVWDTGIGIPDGQINEGFELFRQLDNGNTRGKQGSGLGLAVVAQIAQLLGLGLRVHSREGQGSLFAVELPLARDGDGQPKKILGRFDACGLCKITHPEMQ